MKTPRRAPASPDFAEFLPAAIEIEATPPRPPGRMVLWTVMALCVAAVVWAGVSRVEVIAVAPGRLVPGETLAVVVPHGPALEVEALVLNRDIGFIAAGQPAVIKLEAYPFTRHSTLDGVVSRVGAEAMTHEALGPVYPVRLRIAANAVRVAGRTARLSSGMAASVEIRTGQRRVIDCFLSARG